MARRDRSGFDARRKDRWPTFWDYVALAGTVAVILAGGLLTLAIAAGWLP